MKRIQIHSFFSFFLSFTLLISPLPITAMFDKAQEEYTDIAMDADYIQLNNDEYNIVHFIHELSLLDVDEQSPLHALKKYISNGFLIALKNEVLHVLGYAEWFLEQESISLDASQRNKLLLTIDDLVQAIIEDQLTIGGTTIDLYKTLPLMVINKRLQVKGKTRLLSELIVEGKARFHNPVRFYKRAHFKDNVIIDGVASMQDAVIQNLDLVWWSNNHRCNAWYCKHY